MVKTLLRSAVLAALLTMALCVVAVGADWTSWWDVGTPNVTYFWDNWYAGINPYTCPADLITPAAGGVGAASITVDEFGAGLMDGPYPGYGSATRFWDVGPGGGMHVNTTASDLGMDIWVQVVCHEAFTAAPTISVSGAYAVPVSPGVFVVRELVESTGDVGPSEGPPEYTGWYSYTSLWRLDPGVTFAGIDIAADPDFGTVIDKVKVGTRELPEPSAIVLGVLGSGALFGLRRYRRRTTA